MTFTYDLSTEIGKIRLAIGDVSEAVPMLSDEEITALVAQSESWQEAAVRCVDAILARCARMAIDITVGPMSKRLSQMMDHYRALRAQLAEQLAINLQGTVGAEALAFGWVEAAEESEGEYGA